MIGGQPSIPATTAPTPPVSNQELALAGRLHSRLHDLLNHPGWKEAFEPHVAAQMQALATKVLEDREGTDEQRREWLRGYWTLQDLLRGLSQKHAEVKRVIERATNQHTEAAPIHPLSPASAPVYQPPKVVDISVGGLLDEFKKDFNPFGGTPP